MFNIRNRVLGHGKVRVNGVTFVIKKLTPKDFLDSEGMYPFSIITDTSRRLDSEEEALRRMEGFKASIKDIILRAVVSPKVNGFIDELMETEAYIKLFNAIFLHSMGGLKKKLLLRCLLAKRQLMQSIS